MNYVILERKQTYWSTPLSVSNCIIATTLFIFIFFILIFHECCSRSNRDRLAWNNYRWRWIARKMLRESLWSLSDDVETNINLHFSIRESCVRDDNCRAINLSLFPCLPTCNLSKRSAYLPLQTFLAWIVISCNNSSSWIEDDHHSDIQNCAIDVAFAVLFF